MWPPVILIALLAGVKLALLAVVGPSVSADSGGYIAYADAILGGTAFAPIAWDAGGIPDLALRLLGYPLLIAAIKLITPDYWAYGVVIAQGALSLAAMVLVFRVAERIFGPAGATASVLLYAASGSLLWDNSLRADSVYASLFVIVLFTLAGAWLGCWRLSSLKLAGLGLLWGYSILTRDSGLYFTFLPVAALLAIGFAAPAPIWRRCGPAVAFLIVVVAVAECYRLFNLYRTGEAFFSIAGAENYLQPLFVMRHYRYADPFDGSGLVASTIRSAMLGDDFSAQIRYVALVQERCACVPTQLQSLIFGQYLSSIAHHPFAYLRVVVKNFNYFGLASDLGDPIGNINQFVQLGTVYGERVIPGLSVRHLAELARDFSIGTLSLMLLSAFSNAVAAVLFTLFLFGVPAVFLGEWRRGARPSLELSAIGFLWLAFVSLSVAFSAIHYEARYGLPVYAGAHIGIVYMLLRVMAWQRARAAIVSA